MTAKEQASPSSVASTEALFSPKYRRLSVGILSAVVLSAFEGIGVATAMPVIVRELDGLHLYAWGFGGFLATYLFGLVVAGEICDRRGPSLALVGGLVTFGIGLLLAGLTDSMVAFVCARAVQGFGGGMVMVSLYVLVGRCYPETLRPRAFALMASAWIVPSLVGPPIAGYLADEVSWRWLFLGMCPLVVPTAVLLWPWLRGAERGVTSESPGRPGRIWRGLVAAVGVAVLQRSLQEPEWRGLSLVVAAALLLPTLPHLLPAGTLLGRRGLPTVVAMRGVLAGAFFGTEAFVPLMLVTERSLSTSLAGLSLTAGALGWSLGSWWQGRPGMRIARWLLIRLGCMLVAAAVGLMALVLWDGTPALVSAGAWAIAGVGIGLALTSVNVLVLELSPDEDYGANSAAVQICDALGGILCVGLAGAIYGGLHRQPGNDASGFLVLFGAMAAIALFGAVIASRVRGGGS